ncbi:hypothetical protein GCM10027570_36360 [Streptomonospora sediminis]
MNGTATAVNVSSAHNGANNTSVHAARSRPRLAWLGGALFCGTIALFPMNNVNFAKRAKRVNP